MTVTGWSAVAGQVQRAAAGPRTERCEVPPAAVRRTMPVAQCGREGPGGAAGSVVVTVKNQHSGRFSASEPSR